MNSGRSGIHITQISPENLALFDKDKYLEMNGDIEENVNKVEYEENFHDKKCIMSDNLVRIPHNFNEETGGTAHPHILDPETLVGRSKIHTDVYVNNNFPAGLWKYRAVLDRKMYYGHDMG